MVERIGYVRTSAAEPDLEVQRTALEALGCARFWIDRARPGQSGQPQLLVLLADLRPGDEVVVWRLDRLARSLPQLVWVAAGIAAAGAFLRSVCEENVNTSGEGGAEVRRLFAVLESFQIDVGRDKTLAGLEAARARGSVGGRPSVMTLERVEDARALLSKPGATVAAVARDLGVSRTTLYRHQLHEREA